MFGSGKTTRYIIIAAMILAGVSFIALIMSNFDVDRQTLMSELTAIVILVVALIFGAFLAGIGLRALMSRREGENDDEDDRE